MSASTYENIERKIRLARTAKVEAHAARQATLDAESAKRDARRREHEAEALAASAQADVYQARAEHYQELYELATSDSIAHGHRRKMIWNSNRALEYRVEAHQAQKRIV